MRPPSSKNSKRTSDEDRSRKKKKKSKSSKRRRDPSISSYSSSDSDVDSRSRRKSKKSKKMERSDKKKKETKKIEKKRSRKKRYRRDSSVSSLSSYSSRSCSTCSDLRRSRSPVKQRSDRKSSKSNPRKRERERGRKISRHHKSNHGDRHRSPRCSTCSRSRSASSSHSRGRSPIVERYREQGETKRLRSVLAVSRVDDEGKDKIIKAYDDYPTFQSDEGKKKDQNLKEDSYDSEISKRVDPLKGMNRLTRDFDVDHDDGSAKDYPVTSGSQLVMSFDDRYEGSLVAESESTKTYTMTKAPEVAVDDSGKEAADLELILRQKALENLRKYKFASKLERNQDSKICSKTLELESSHPNYLEEHSHAQGASSSSELKAMSVPTIATEKNEGNGVQNHLIKSGSCMLGASSTISRKAPNNLKLSEKSSNKISSEEILLAKDADNKRIAAQLGSGESTGAEIGLTDRPTSGALNTDSDVSKPIKSLLESASGSQFENKTFSRVRDGEMVQVSYKVYIPKKAPALARRQLQR